MAHAFREEATDVVVLHAMGAECVTRGLKAAWQAQKFLEGDGVVARIHPSFSVPKEGDDFKCKVELRLVATRRGEETRDDASARGVAGATIAVVAIVGGGGAACECAGDDASTSTGAVSYTHLTLPTIYSV